MKERETLKLYNSITNIEDKYIQEAQIAKKKNKPVWLNWGAAAACLCLISVSAIIISHIYLSVPTPDNGVALIPNIVQPSIANSEQPAKEQEIFVPITSLLAGGNYGITESAAAFGKVSIGQYTGVYEKVPSVESAVLSENRGSSVSGAEGWYCVSGHADMQYLIRNINGEYSLWKFSCFDSEEYPYCDVLEIVYQIDSADRISEIIVTPARMDNTDGGKAIQEKIGTYIIADRGEIDTIYQILSSLTCYGSNHWDMIDYGDAEAPADANISSHQAVLLGRCLSIVTDYGNEIDGLKYTAVSNMFYEFSGIAYNRLSTEQAERVYEIFRITENAEDLQHQTNEGSDKSSPANEYKSETLIESDNTGISLEYITELQSKVSDAMIKGELPFVTSSAVYENPYRLHIVVTSNSQSDLQKLLELDTMGGALEIEYFPGGVNKFE